MILKRNAFSFMNCWSNNQLRSWSNFSPLSLGFSFERSQSNNWSVDYDQGKIIRMMEESRHWSDNI